MAFMVTFYPAKVNAQCPDEVCFNLESLTFPANLWRVEDILNLWIENTTSEDLEMYLEVTVTEEFLGEIFRVSSGVFTLGPGIPEYINPSQLEPIYVDYDQKYKEYVTDVVTATGSLPAGAYTICVTAYKPDDQVCGNECIPQEIAHPSPPELIYPSDQSVVTEDLPLFSWLPPMPSAGRVKYTVNIVEILDGQTPVEAMESNFRWFIQSVEDITSLQYPLTDRKFTYGTKYAWLVEALMGPAIIDRDINPVIASPVWSFTYLGTKEAGFAEQYLISLNSPSAGENVAGPPFFEWDMIVSSDAQAGKTLAEEDVYYNLKIWKWPESPGIADAESYMAELEDNPDTEPFYEAEKIPQGYFDMASGNPDTMRANFTYFWKVSCIKDENIIAESPVSRFMILPDNRFIEAAESMLRAAKPEKGSEIFGIIEPVTPGAIIISEEPSELDTINVNRTLYLFIIDNDPGAKFGHPVKYVTVDQETKAAAVYSANWFPEVKYVEDPWNTTGETTVNGTDITVLTPRTEKESGRTREFADIEDIQLQIECKKYILLIDGGDRNRINTADNIGYRAARDADSMQALYKKKYYEVRRFSQYWDYNNTEIKSIPVDQEAKTGKKYIRDLLTGIKNQYVSRSCCSGPDLNLELVIYINANAVPSTSKFRIYKPDGLGAYEDIDYFEDVLKYLQALPQCVKVTLFVDANFSGCLTDGNRLDSYLKRGNFEIRTATDANSTTPSGVGSPVTTVKPSASGRLATQANAAPANAKPGTRGNQQSLSDITQLLEKAKELQAGQSTGKVSLGENYAAVDETLKNQSKQAGKPYPNPRFASVHARDEFSLQFPNSNNERGIRDCKVEPERSANTILNTTNGQVTVFSKIKGEIKIIVTYDNDYIELMPVTSRWGDDS